MNILILSLLLLYVVVVQCVKFTGDLVLSTPSYTSIKITAYSISQSGYVYISYGIKTATYDLKSSTYGEYIYTFICIYIYLYVCNFLYIYQ